MFQDIKNISYGFYFQNDTAEGDQKLDKCINKFLKQLSLLSWDKLPCVDYKKLSGLYEDTKVFKEFYNKIPEKCKIPQASIIQSCASTILNELKKLDSKMRMAVIMSWTRIFESVNGCFQMLKEKTKNLDKYILSGCE